MTNEEAIWIATVFDCEGNIHTRTKPHIKKNGQVTEHSSTVIAIGHCSPDLIKRFYEIIQIGRVYSYENKSYRYNYEKKDGSISHYNTKEKKQVYWWKISKRWQVRKFLELISECWLSEHRIKQILEHTGVDMAQKTGALRHTHRYIRTFPNVRRQEPIWQCRLPGCSHFIPHNATVIGRNSICWECGEIFTMEEANLEQGMPTCAPCRDKSDSTKEVGPTLEDIKRFMVAQKISKARNKPIEDVTSEEVDNWIQMWGE